MKRSIFITVLLTVFSLGSTFATSIIIVKDPPPTPIPNRGTISLPVTADISATDLAVYFESSVGVATVTVYNEFDQVIDQQTVNTEATTEVFIPADSWLSGNYKLTITYDTTTHRGEFQTE